MRSRRARVLAGASLAGLTLTGCANRPRTAPVEAQAVAARSSKAEIAYRVLIDRFANGDPTNDEGGLTGGPLVTGFDPTHPRFYHGGDLTGLTERLGYVQGLGVTTLILSPVLGNLPVAGSHGEASASFHGTWLTDLTRVDPHLGTSDDLKQLVDAAHARGMRVVLDVVVNATADVITYEGCGGGCAYRGVAAYPYTTRGGALGQAINAGYAAGEGEDDPFAGLVRADWAYDPYVPMALEGAKQPTWLNDPRYYHNRGEAGRSAEGQRLGDHDGRDDLFTEHPRVAAGLTEAYGNLVSATGLDGVRVLEADRVDESFLRAFAAGLTARAGEGFTVTGVLAASDARGQAHALGAGLEAVDDEALRAALAEVASGSAPADRLAAAFADDAFYPKGAAARLPTFASSPEQGRLARFVREARPEEDPERRLRRLQLAYVLLLTARGTPVILQGDEQGFGGTGDASYQDMFASLVPSYLDDDLLGTEAGLGDENFDEDHPLYRLIAELSAMRRREPALAAGGQQVRLADHEGGLFVFAREDEASGSEILIALNFGEERRDGFAPVPRREVRWSSLVGYCASDVAAEGSYPVSVPGLSFVICRAAPPAAQRQGLGERLRGMVE